MLAEFETIYRAHVGAVMGFFARRSIDPETVADLTSETFARAMRSFATFDPRRGSAGAWLFGIARRVYAQHRASTVAESEATGRLAARRVWLTTSSRCCRAGSTPNARLESCSRSSLASRRQSARRLSWSSLLVLSLGTRQPPCTSRWQRCGCACSGLANDFGRKDGSDEQL